MASVGKINNFENRENGFKNTKCASNPRAVGNNSPAFGRVYNPFFIINKPNPALEKTMNRLLKDNPDLFGDSFEKAFVAPLDEFLQDCEVKIFHEEFPDSMLQLNYDARIASDVNMIQANFVNKRGKFLTQEDETAGVSKNQASVYLMKSLCTDSLEMEKLDNPLFLNPVPDYLKWVTYRIYENLIKLNKCWWKTEEFLNDSDKVEQLKRVVAIIMPEKS